MNKINQIVQEVLEAEARIRSHIRTTDVVKSSLDRSNPSRRVWLKLENQQVTGSFKARGSMNKVLSMSATEKQYGAITASTGNHGMGVARALELTGTSGSIYLPKTASKAKIEKLEVLGGNLEFVDGSCLNTELYAKSIANETSATWISPYNDLKIIGGQGTIGIEILDQCPTLTRVFVTVGGGGLISGVAAILKHFKPSIKIVGCLPSQSPEMYLSVKAGHIVDLDEEKETLSDGSAGGVEEGSITFPLCQQLVDEWALVSESDIAHAMRSVYHTHQMVIEGAAGVAVAGWMHSESDTGTDLVIICGGNIDSELFQSVIGESST